MRRLVAEQAQGAAAEFVPALADALAQWLVLSQEIGRRAAANPEEVGAASYDYLMLSGYVTLAYWWARSVAAAEASSLPAAFKAGKRETARFYYGRILPRIAAHRAAIESGAATLMALDAEAFDS